MRNLYNITLALLAVVISIAASQTLRADVVLDGTLGQSGSLTGPDYAITSDFGYISGTNLFHSFDTFNIDTYESATFSGPDSIENIISRVTGGDASWIDGTISCDIIDANLYFLNPAGVIFGENASLDITGSFYVSTADYLSLGSGGRFDASQPGNTILTSAPVEAFGFLGDTLSDITITGSSLEVEDGESLSVIGGNVTIVSALLSAPAGEINIAGMALPGEVTLDENDSSLGVEQAGGTIFITSDSYVSVNGDDSGQICIRGGNLVIEDASELSSVVQGDSDGGSIDISIDDTLQLSNGGLVNVSTMASGDAGSLTIDAGELVIDSQNSEYFTGLIALVYPGASGHGGDITVEVSDSLTLLNGGTISVSTFDSGDGGSLSVTAGEIFIDGQGSDYVTGFTAQVGSGATGHGGDITVETSGTLTLVDGGEIDLGVFGEGDAGSLSVTAGEIFIDGQDSGSMTGFVAQVYSGGIGDGGDISVETSGLLSVANGGEITVSILGEGDAGSLSVTAGDIVIDRQDSEYVTGITAQVYSGGTGDGGDVSVEVAGRLELVNGGEISVSTFDSGDGGSLVVTADEILIDGYNSEHFTGFAAQVNTGAVGDGGDVSIEVAGILELVDGGNISVSTSGAGDAGNLTVTAGEISIDGQGSEYLTGFAAQVNSGGTGDGGDITVETSGTLTLANGGNISVSTYDEGDAGNLTVTAGEISIDGQGSEYLTGFAAQVNPGGTGDAGDMFIETSGLLSVVNGGEISVSTSGAGDAGNLTVTAGEIVIDGQESEYLTGFSAQVESGVSGHGGDITIETCGTLTLLNGGTISAATFGPGDAGSLSVTAGEVFIDGQESEYLTGFIAQVNPGGTGDGGDIFIETSGLLSLVDGGVVSVSTYDSGNAGSLTVTAGEIVIDGQDSELSTGLTAWADSDSTGNGGEISVLVTGSLELYNGGSISSSSYSTGVAGDISVQASSILLQDNSSVSTETIVSDGGNITLTATDLLHLSDSQVTTSVAGGDGTGGNITIDPVFVVLDSSDIIANAYEGSGENISLSADYYFADSDSRVEASSQLGIDGVITIDTPNIDLSSSLASLPVYQDIPLLESDSCESGTSDTSSSLVIRGRGSIPPDPDHPLAGSFEP